MKKTTNSFKTFIRKTGIFKFKLVLDKKKGRKSLIGFRENPKTISGKRSSLVIIPRTNDEKYVHMADGEFWEVEYEESENASVAYATPIKRAELEYSTVFKKKSVGFQLSVKGVKGKKGLIFMKVFPNSRRYTEFTSDVILAKIVKHGLSAYKNDIITGYQDALQQVSLAEITAADIVRETLAIIQDMDSEVEGRKTTEVSTEIVLRKIQGQVNPFTTGEYPDPPELAGEVMDSLRIVAHVQGMFKVLV